jgi:ribosomal protein S18 acetylase RimI-like enzyme
VTSPSLAAVRVARPTVDLGRIRAFYEHVVGLRLLGSFVDHDGFDGAIFGLLDERAQLELVNTPHGHVPAPTNEDVLVLYPTATAAADDLVDRLLRAGTLEVTTDPTLNPYWPRNGARAFVDPDGYRLIVAPEDVASGQPPDTDSDQSMGETTLRVVPTGPQRDAYLPLLQLADDSVEQVLGYYQTGVLFALDGAAGNPIGIVLAIDESDGSVELKAVAVDESWHGLGVGTRMLLAALGALRARGVRRVVVGTSSAGIGQLAFYQKAGFRLRSIERDFFTPGRGYASGIVENGIPLRDMVWMDQELADARADGG